MDFITKIKGLSYLGWGGVIGAVRYAIARDRYERRWRPRGKPAVPVALGGILEAVPQPWGATFRLAEASLEVRFLAPDLVRVTWEPGALPLPYAIAKTDWAPVEARFTAAPGSWTLATDALEVVVAADGSITLAEPGRPPLRADEPPRRAGDAWVHRARLRPDEHCYGLGLRSAPLDLVGGTYALWNREPKGAYAPGDDPLYVCVPAWLGLHDDGTYLVFFENSHRGQVSFAGASEARFDGGALRYYLVPGPPARALERYTELTGRPSMPPRWSLGYHQCRWSYMDEAEVREVADGFTSRGLPLSAIHLDIHYMRGHRVFTVDPARFPDLRRLADDLHAKGIRLVLILDPGVKAEPGDPLYEDGLRRDAFCKLPDGRPVIAPVWPGDCAFPDFTKPDARAWWGDQYRRLTDLGVDGFWHDMNEPSAFGSWGDCTLPTAVRHDLEGRGGDHVEGHNVYALLEARAGFEALERLLPDRRPWILSRSGWAGLQRYAWNWTGDSETNLWSLRQSLRIALSLGLTGIPYTGPDIGGFGGRPGPELFLRWFQLAAFLPFFRTHSAFFTPRREPWCFDEATFAVLGDFLRLRQHLLPYWYTLAREAHLSGTPLVRPLFWADPSDPELHAVDDAFLVGDALLVAPVLEEEARARTVRLPRGRWIGWWDGEAVEGGRTAVVDAPLDRIPLWGREGAVIPARDGSTTVMHVFVPAGDGPGPGGRCFHDAGDGHGPWRLYRWSVSRQGGTLELSRTADGTLEPGPDEEVEIRLHGGIATGVQADGLDVPAGASFRLPAGFRRAVVRL